MPEAFWDIAGEHHGFGRSTKDFDAIFSDADASVFIFRAYDVMCVI